MRLFFGRERDRYERHTKDLTLAGGAELLTVLRSKMPRAEAPAYAPCKGCGVIVRGGHVCGLADGEADSKPAKVVKIRSRRK